eukprot:1563776-Pyramimonas_sp.AAC.1
MEAHISPAIGVFLLGDLCVHNHICFDILPDRVLKESKQHVRALSTVLNRLCANPLKGHT